MYAVDVVFVLLFFLLPVLLIAILQVNNISVISLSIPMFSIQMLFVLAYMGYFFLYFGLDDYRAEEGVTIQNTIFIAFCYSAYCIFSIGIVMVIFSKVLSTNFTPQNLDNIAVMNRLEFFLIVLLFSTVLIVLTVYLIKIPKIALFTAILEGHEAAKSVRSDMGSNFPGKYHWYSLFMHEIAALLSYTLFSSWLILRTKMLGVFMAAAFLLTSFTMLMASEKAPFVWFMIGMFFSYLITVNKGKIPVVKCSFFVVICFIVLILADVLFMGSSNIASAMSSVMSRALTGGITPSYFYLEYFPLYEDFLLGRSFPNPGQIFSFEPYHLTVEIMNWVHPEHIGSDVIGTAPTVFWGEMYANYGGVGVVLAPLLVGSALCIFTFAFNRLRTTPITIGLYTWLILHYKDLATTGISSFLFDFKLIVLIAIVVSILIISNRFRLILN